MEEVLKAIGLGLCVIAAFVLPTVGCGWLGFALWGDPGILLLLAPGGVGFVGMAAYQIGDAMLHPADFFVREEEIARLEHEVSGK